MLKLNIGCGNNYLDGFLNMDLDDKIKCDIKGNVCNIPLPDDSCDFIACNHVLEHLNYSEVKVAFKELKRVLSPNGFIRLSMPNIEEAINKPLEQRNIDIFGLGRWKNDIHQSGFKESDVLELAKDFVIVRLHDKAQWFDRRHDNNSNMEFELR